MASVKHGYFQADGHSLYCSIYLPESAPERAVVICEPFGEEKRCAFRMLVRLAEKLSAAGTEVLRFDLSGTGDSSGTHATASWNAWCRELCAAADFLRNISHCGRVYLAGFRAGALLAAQCAAETACSGLSLVEPVLNGKDMLKELEMRQRIKGFPAEADPSGSRDFAGFRLSSAMQEELEKAELTSAVTALSVPVQLIRVSGGKTFPPAWKPLQQKAESTIVHDKPFWGQVDYFESDMVINPVADFILSH